jgi:hypothetical protein
MTYRFAVHHDDRVIAEAEAPTQQEILHYMLRNDVRTVIDSKPAEDVIYHDARPANWSKAAYAEPAEKVVMRYAMNVSRPHPKS